ncbi:hypothetical protein SAMD00019534_119860 [Acytostelium subglobosum LB1]|uniref:hypothetical protein n=1 Tax=Acytostelium subglobosum LB1 TaxID=1410327 RepID=UPI00064521CE|nr:hypothetical protein SAMD00019534_119860 [Acytostelium subglobosum LB1]GAM28810.1 hypothetical protein SAMD00019534_119860 [Acytostelium subglobosum LB1]|eukprot:XP_012748182.1 hypothetical protein SAMD00019534_119860 [Acytostelium subglobosum LB1]
MSNTDGLYKTEQTASGGVKMKSGMEDLLDDLFTPTVVRKPPAQAITKTFSKMKKRPLDTSSQSSSSSAPSYWATQIPTLSSTTSTTSTSRSTSSTSTTSTSRSTSSSSSQQQQQQPSISIITQPQKKSKPTAAKFSLDSLLKEKKEKTYAKQEPIVTYDELLTEETEKKKSAELDLEINAEQMARLKDLLDIKSDSLLNSIASQKSLLELNVLSLPRPTDLSSILDVQPDDIQSLPCSRLLKKGIRKGEQEDNNREGFSYNNFKMLIQNGLDSILDTFDINSLPKYLIDVLFSYGM